MTSSLKDRHVVVTGGGAGIGLGCVEACLAAGARVTAFDISEEAEARISAAGAVFARVDVADPARFAAALTEARRAVGRLDGLINNAGVTIAEPFLEARLDVFERLWQVNQRSVLVGCQSAARIMVEDGNAGAIVNLSSVHSRASDAGFEAYAGTKGAIAAMTRAMAWSLGRHGIRVNALCPGLTLTESIRAATNADDHARFASWSATGEITTPLEMGRIAAFLLSDEARVFSGADLVADQATLARLGGDAVV